MFKSFLKEAFMLEKYHEKGACFVGGATGRKGLKKGFF